MYTNTFKNEVTTDQKGKLLLNTCGILFYCRNGEKSTAIKRMQTVQGSLLSCFFYLILNIQVNNFSVMSGHSTKIKMRGSREGGRGTWPPPWKVGNLWGSLAILVQIPWKIKSY